jgi:outer membrane protein OmpA-like peptidoglycan-associated protein
MAQNRHSQKFLLVVFAVMAAMALAAPIAARSAINTGGVYTSREEIREAQAALVQDGELAPGSFQVGVLDDPTVEALRSFQSRHGLRRTGVIDYETMAQLTSHFIPGDADGDWVTDALDGCPNTSEGAEVDEHGCPKDADGDGVPNGLDRCPGTPRGAEVDSRGCADDADRDKVPDGIDRCPDTPGGATVDMQGCPSDSDKDGVDDGLDYCADTRAGSQVDTRGCPEQTRLENLFKGQQKLTLEGVNFESNSAKLTSDSRSVLDHVAFYLKDSSDVKVEIGGYTDTTGTESHNLELSQERADAVRDFLISEGVDASRLVAKGYGENDPIAGNNSARGRAENRRVELTKLE